MLAFSWIGNQLYTTLAEQNAHPFSNTVSDQQANPEKMQGFQLPLYTKDIDADDLLEFTSGQDNAQDGIEMNLVNDQFTDRSSNENKHISYRFFNGEYYGNPDDQFAKYCSTGSSSPTDRYLLKIPSTFLSPDGQPPQHIG